MAQRTLLHYLPDLVYPLSVVRSFARAACFFRARAIRPSVHSSSYHPSAMKTVRRLGAGWIGGEAPATPASGRLTNRTAATVSRRRGSPPRSRHSGAPAHAE